MTAPYTILRYGRISREATNSSRSVSCLFLGSWGALMQRGSQLTHGSFSSILSSLGQQALELQLERFFTVWAWTWDLDKDFKLCVDLGARMSLRRVRTAVYLTPPPLSGLPLHPSYPLILPAIDDFSSQIPEGVAALVLTQSHVAPSSRYRSSRYPVALARHLMNHVTPTPGPASLPASTTQPDRLVDVSRGDHDDRPNTEPPPSGGFLGASISMSMDVRKWTWPSFGKAPNTKEMVTNAGDDVASHCVSGRAEAQVDQSALEDAIASDNSFGLPTEKPCALERHEKHPVKLESDVSEADTPRPSIPSPALDSSEATLNCSLPEVETSTTVCSEKPRFTWMDVFLAPSHESLATSRRRVYLLKVSTDNVVTHQIFNLFPSAASMLLPCSITTRMTWMRGWNRPYAYLKMWRGS